MINNLPPIRRAKRKRNVTPSALVNGSVRVNVSSRPCGVVPVRTENSILAMKSPFFDDAAPISSSNYIQCVHRASISFHF